MKKKQILAILSLVLVFITTASGGPVLAERTNPELEFLIESTRVSINKQEVIINSLRKRYEAILNRERALQQFIDEENKKIEESKLAKNRPLVKPLKTAPVPQKRLEARIPVKASKAQEIARRNAAQDEILKRQEKNVPAVLKPGVEKKKITLPVTEESKQANIRCESLKRQIAQQEAELRDKENKIKQLLVQEKIKKDQEDKKKIEIELKQKQQAELEKKKQEQAQAALEKKAREELKIEKQKQLKLLAEQKAQGKKAQDEVIKQQRQVELEKKNEAARAAAEKKAGDQKAKEELINEQQQATLFKKQEKEKELLRIKLEKERLLAAQQQQRLISERDCQMRLLLEADKNAKHEKYVAQLGQLLNRQNALMEETKKLESQIHQEESTLRALEKTRQDVIRKLLENS